MVAVASVAFPACALAAARAVHTGHDRLAGLLLLLSVATPTYYAYPLNLPALLIGIALLAWPAGVVGNRIGGGLGRQPTKPGPTAVSRH